MAWMSASIYLRNNDITEVAAGLERLLTQGTLASDREGILDAPAPMLVSPALEGWVAVLGAREWLSPLPEVAAQLSRTCHAETLCAEVVGNSYRARLCRAEAGKEKERITLPEGGFFDDPLEQPEPSHMPLYDDAEHRAFVYLREQGVPAPLVLLGTAPLGHPPRDHRPVGEGIALEVTARQGVRHQAREMTGPHYLGDDPPSLPTHVSRDFGLMLLEERYVEGAPSEEALERLLCIEGALLDRAARAAPHERVSLTVTYRSPLHQQQLDAMLRRRHHHTLPREDRMRPPWWQFWHHIGFKRP